MSTLYSQGWEPAIGPPAVFPLAAAGATVNYALVLILEFRDHADQPAYQAEAATFRARPETSVEWLIYVLRELARADFCFVVLLLACFDALLVLLLLAALGAQVYWLAQFVAKARTFRV